jgi:hypothetical protein
VTEVVGSAGRDGRQCAVLGFVTIGGRWRWLCRRRVGVALLEWL